jgi:invasion protein IalB
MQVDCGVDGSRAAAAAFAAVVCASSDLRAQGAVKSSFGDWQMRCETGGLRRSSNGGAGDVSVQAEDKPNISLVVIVLKTADGKSRLLSNT